MDQLLSARWVLPKPELARFPAILWLCVIVQPEAADRIERSSRIEISRLKRDLINGLREALCGCSMSVLQEVTAIVGGRTCCPFTRTAVVRHSVAWFSALATWMHFAQQRTAQLSAEQLEVSQKLFEQTIRHMNENAFQESAGLEKRLAAERPKTLALQARVEREQATARVARPAIPSDSENAKAGADTSPLVGRATSFRLHPPLY